MAKFIIDAPAVNLSTTGPKSYNEKLDELLDLVTEIEIDELLSDDWELEDRLDFVAEIDKQELEFELYDDQELEELLNELLLKLLELWLDSDESELDDSLDFVTEIDEQLLLVLV